MAIPVNFPESTDVSDFPPGGISRPLPVKKFPRSSVSCWQLSQGEIQEVLDTNRIWLVNQTFEKLDKRDDEVRWQPIVSVTAFKDEALSGDFIAETATRSTAPGSDRIVRFDDNQPAYGELKEAFADLTGKLTEANDIGGLADYEIIEARREVMVLQQAMACEGVRLAWFEAMATKTLTWLAAKTADTVVKLCVTAALIKLAAWIAVAH